MVATSDSSGSCNNIGSSCGDNNKGGIIGSGDGDRGVIVFVVGDDNDSDNDIDGGGSKSA